jgi:hypothetical protein
MNPKRKTFNLLRTLASLDVALRAEVLAPWNYATSSGVESTGVSVESIHF